MKWIGTQITYDNARFSKNLTIGGKLSVGESIDQTSGDYTLYEAVNDANPSISIGKDSNDRAEILSEFHSGAQTFNRLRFRTFSTSSATNAGRILFQVDETSVGEFKDSGFNVAAGKSLLVGGVDILTSNGSGVTTLNNIDDLDATTIATFNSHLTAGDITGVTAGTGLSGGGTSGAVTLNVDAAQTQITSVGTIGTGAWQGSPIETAYIGDNQITDDKLDDELLAEIDANTAKATNVTTNLTATTHASQITINSSDGTNVVVAEASGSIAGVMTVAHHDKLDGIETSATADQTRSDIEGLAITSVGTIGEGTWNGTAIAHAYIGADAIEGDNIADNAVDSEHYTDGTIDTAHIADDQVTFAKALGVTPNVFGNVIKLLPSDFMANDDGGNTKFGVGYVDHAGSTFGMRAANSATELFAFVSIPQGMTATHVDIFDKNDVAFEVFEIQVNATTMVSKGSGNCNTTVDITDVASTATNFLGIRVTTTSVNDKVYGGTVTIA